MGYLVMTRSSIILIISGINLKLSKKVNYTSREKKWFYVLTSSILIRKSVLARAKKKKKKRKRNA